VRVFFPFPWNSYICVNIYMYVCRYIYEKTYVNTCTHMCMGNFSAHVFCPFLRDSYIYVYTYIHVCVYVCICLRMYNAYVYIYIYLRMYIYENIYINS